MAYSEELAQRVRVVLQDELGVREQKMFGGLCFMLRGNMCCGVVKDKLMLRVAPEQYAAALERPNAHKMDFTGRPMKGMIDVDGEGIASDEVLADWVQWGDQFCRIATTEIISPMPKVIMYFLSAKMPFQI